MSETYHIPVLAAEVLETLTPAPGDIVVDATLGGGGHALLLAQAIGADGLLVGIDQDPDALRAATARLAGVACRVHIARGNFGDLDRILRDAGLLPSNLEGGGVDVLLADLGVSSHQVDTPARGFSLGADGPLDMRMGQQGPTLLTVLDGVDESALAVILKEGGDVPKARRVARAILQTHQDGALTSTMALRAVCESVLGRPKPGVIHPATTVFQALRIAVNDELRVLDTLLETFPAWLRAGGRAGFISFHSGEDRKVKRALRALMGVCTCPPELPLCVCDMRPRGEIVTRRPIQAGKAEVAANPRARSAKLRVFRAL